MNPGNRLAGVLLLISLVSMIAGAVIVVPSGLTLSPIDPGSVLVAVRGQVGLHLTELALDVAGWIALMVAGLVIAAAARPSAYVVAGGLLAGAGLAGVLHDAGNLAVTQLGNDPEVARAVLLTAKWEVNLAGLLWVVATVAAAVGIPMPAWLRVAGMVAAVSGLAAVVLPWTTGVAVPSVAMEQLGYALHLPVMIWYGVLGGRWLRGGGASGG